MTDAAGGTSWCRVRNVAKTLYDSFGIIVWSKQRDDGFPHCFYIDSSLLHESDFAQAFEVCVWPRKALADRANLWPTRTITLPTLNRRIAFGNSVDLVSKLQVTTWRWTNCADFGILEFQDDRPSSGYS